MEPNPKENGRRPVFFRRRDILIAAAVLAVAVVLWLLLAPGGVAGGAARVSVGLGDGQYSLNIPLGKDGVHDLDAELPVHLEVRDGAIRFVRSECPDHNCEDFGWLRHEGDWAACLPAGVVVRIGEDAASVPGGAGTP